MRTGWLAMMVVPVLAACGTEPAPPAGSLPGAAAQAGWIAVDFEDGTPRASWDAWEREWGVDLEPNSPWAEDEALTIGRVTGDVEAVLARIRSHRAVEVAEPLFLYEAQWEPNDPQYGLQWHLHKVGAAEAWNHSRGRGVVVAVVDTGIAYRDLGERFRVVEDLKGARFADGWDFVHDRAEAVDDHGHGTHVAGTVAQVTDNGLGVAGLAPEAVLMPVKVLDGRGMGTSADIADGIRWAAEHGARVINLSLGGGGHSRVVAQAVAEARRQGAVVVAAAGNASVGRVAFPAALDGVLAVSATRFDDALAPYSSWGKALDLAAPGGDKSVDQNGDGHPDGVLQNTLVRGDPSRGAYEWYQGTSMATPHVSGAAALVMATGVTDPEDVEAALVDTARKVQGRTGWDTRYGHGVVDAAAAVTHARGRLSLGRLLWAALVALVLLFRAGRLPLRGTLGFLISLVLTAVGLFVLPWLKLPGLSALAHPLMDWGLLAFGPAAHANPLTWSALVPFALALVLAQVRPLRPWLAGVAAGASAFLLHALLRGQADVVWLPGRLLDLVWLGLNAGFAFLLAWTLMRRAKA